MADQLPRGRMPDGVLHVAHGSCMAHRCNGVAKGKALDVRRWASRHADATGHEAVVTLVYTYNRAQRPPASRDAAKDAEG